MPTGLRDRRMNGWEKETNGDGTSGWMKGWMGGVDG